MAIDLGKAKKILSQSFLEENASINEDEAAQLIVKAEQTVKALTEEMEADEQLSAAKQVVKDLQGAYKSALAYEHAKIRFLLEKIDEIRGENAD
jgi:phosphoglycerate-specific signal transduction histidine kinase